MTTRGSRGPPVKAHVVNTKRRKTALDVDLNVPLSENRGQEGTSAHANSQYMEPGQLGGYAPPTAIDVESFDDEVLISSPRAFAQAKVNSRRNRRSTIVVDVDSEERTSSVASNGRNKRKRVSSNQATINYDLCINLDGPGTSMKEKVPSVKPPPPPAPKEPTFSCPVCMGPLVEEMSTKCGHIFCKKCIKAAITAQSKCPTCRRKVTMKDTIRVYLPATN